MLLTASELTLSVLIRQITPVIDEVAIQQPSDYCVWNCLTTVGVVTMVRKISRGWSVVMMSISGQSGIRMLASSSQVSASRRY